MTRCLFCKADSSASRSIEHIIPESLGNTASILPRGVVCDGCNNYFARKVEGPFLESPALRQLRFHQAVENKRGRVPSIEGVILPDIRVLLSKFPGEDDMSVAVPTEAVGQIARRKKGTLLLPLSGAPPQSHIVSRFLAKVALESAAERLLADLEGLACLLDEAQLDQIRNHARRGMRGRWPVHIRTIYPANGSVLGSDNRREQVLHEWDFLMTPTSEWYFVLAIFGVEFTINLGGPEIDGYLRWLEANGGDSPLYSPRNGGRLAMPR